MELVGIVLAAIVALLLAWWGLDAALLARVGRGLRASVPHDEARFSPSMVARLPDPAQRYLRHAVRVGAPLPGAVELTMTGELRLSPSGRWAPMRARQILVPGVGFLWQPVLRAGPMIVSGGDYYCRGEGGQRFRLWGLLPVVRSGGPDIARSARGRLVMETIWNPASLLPGRGGEWRERDACSAIWSTNVDGEALDVVFEVRDDGALAAVRAERWGDHTPDRRFAHVPFGAEILAEMRVGDFAVPRRVRVGWRLGEDAAFEFFHAEIRSVRFR